MGMRRILYAVLLAAAAATAAGAGEAVRPARRWLYLPTNLYVNDNVAKAEALLKRAAAAGYNGVLFTDFKTATWWTLDDPARWKRNAQALRRMTRDLGMDLVVCVAPFGYSGGILHHDPNLAAGMPVREAPFVVRGGELVPEPTASIRNGSFEEVRGDAAAGFAFQDGPGVSSFADTAVARAGRVSLRFENFRAGNEAGNGRICARVDVRPWQQYRLRVWMKTEALDADMIQVIAIGNGRTLQHQAPSRPTGGERAGIGSPRGLTTDWIEQSVAFNSLDCTNVSVYAGVWGGRSGRIWWDDLRIDDAPLLNVVRRDSLPLVLAAADGAALAEGRDVEPIVDPGMGAKPWKGCYDTYHEPPRVRLAAGSRVREGDRVRLSAWHTAIVNDGQVACSLAEPAVFEVCEREIAHAAAALEPDGWMLSHDEIRTGGWEPAEVAFGSAGRLLAANVKRCIGIARRAGGGRPVHVWSDMFDPAHNARKDYYLFKGDLAGSWEGLDRDTVVIKWGGGRIARPGLEFFASRGHRQVIAAFYDGDPARDRAMWSEASAGVPDVLGAIYTTWRNDYASLESFARLWWGAP
jgi:hypothetical protein